MIFVERLSLQNKYHSRNYNVFESVLVGLTHPLVHTHTQKAFNHVAQWIWVLTQRDCLTVRCGRDNWVKQVVFFLTEVHEERWKGENNTDFSFQIKNLWSVQYLVFSFAFLLFFIPGRIFFFSISLAGDWNILHVRKWPGAIFTRGYNFAKCMTNTSFDQWRGATPG